MKGFNLRNLFYMLAFAVAWDGSEPIVQTPSAQLTNLAALATRFPLPWSAYVRLLSVKSETARAFYETEALRCGWSVRQLNRQIGSQFYERIALSKNKAAMLKKAEKAEADDLMTPEEAIKDHWNGRDGSLSYVKRPGLRNFPQ